MAPIKSQPSGIPFHTAQPVNVQAWADEATEALHTVSIPTAAQRGGKTVNLAIPLDEALPSRPKPRRESTIVATAAAVENGADSPAPPARAIPRREPIRRDSLKRREALLKGKEGSRRRQRWENDRLLNNPWAQPPLPSDWEVHPTYPRHVVPYFLAPLWDKEVTARREAESAAREARAAARSAAASSTERKYATPAAAAGVVDANAGKVPRELRSRLKRAKAARGLLQDLEEEVRRFVQGWERRQARRASAGLLDADSSDEEIVFVGRGGRMMDEPPSPKARRDRDVVLVEKGGEGEEATGGEVLQKQKLVYDGLVGDRGASFGRWLVHSIASYYGLPTWSVTVGDPARREAYVGIKQMDHGKQAIGELPRPLWGLV